jgi:hypothetical protein
MTMLHGARLRAFIAAIVVVCVAILFITPDPAVAVEQSPAGFLHSIYDHYLGEKAPGVPLKTHAKIRRYFESSLAALIINDEIAAAKRNEPPTLDGDPFVDAQEWHIPSIDIRIERTGDGKAVGVVAFKNFNKPVTVTLELVKLKAAWKISDITWGDETLRDLYNATPK